MCMCMRARVCVMLAETQIYTDKYLYIYIRYTYIVVLWRVGSGVGT